MNITRGKNPGALKVGVYGPEGVGNSTFASCFPGAVFCDTEGSTSHMDVARFDKPEKWMDIHAAVDWTLQHPDQVGTFVLDTADWAEKLGARYVCQEEPINKSGDTRGWDSIEAPGYGKGYVYLKAAFQKLLDKMSEMTEKGVNVVITAHALLRKFEQPDELGAYDRWALKLNEKNVAPLIKEWADMVLFVNFRTDVVKSPDGKTKGRGGQKRVMYTQHSACWDAKNRFGLDDELPFDFQQIAHLFQDHAPAEEVHEPEPAKPAPLEIKPATASVTTTETIPGVGKPAGKTKKAKVSTARPDSMKSEDKDKDALLAEVWKKMCEAGVPDPNCLQGVVAEKGYYDVNVLIRDYDTEFIEGCLIGAWDAVRELCQTKYNNLPF